MEWFTGKACRTPKWVTARRRGLLTDKSVSEKPFRVIQEISFIGSSLCIKK
jgi:hypothetical protein